MNALDEVRTARWHAAGKEEPLLVTEDPQKSSQLLAKLAFPARRDARRACIAGFSNIFVAHNSSPNYAVLP